MHSFHLVWLILLFFTNGISQKQNFFQAISSNNVPSLNISFDAAALIDQKFVDTTVRGSIQWEDLDGNSHLVRTKLTLRGKYRRRICSFPPIKMDFDKDDLQDMGLKKHDEYKLVTHCSDHPEQETYVRKEYLAYQIQRILLPYAYQVHYLTANYIDVNSGSTISGPAFIIENDKDLEDRLDVKELPGFNDSLQVDSLALKSNALFQMLIANDDYDLYSGRNCKAFSKEDQVIPVSYDFDFAGFVNAEYARVNPNVPLHRIQDHIYLGPAFTKEEWKSITKEWLGKLDNINELFEKEEILPKKEVNDLRKYVRTFFRYLKQSPPLKTNDVYFFDN